MLKEIKQVLIGDLYWKILSIRYHIDYSKVVLFLSRENKEIDYYALLYLDNVIERKCAKEALILTSDRELLQQLNKNFKIKYDIKVKFIKQKVIELIYKRYCVQRFYKNLFFTYIDKTSDNLLGRFMRETNINAEDIVCLAIYNLRCIPGKEKN